MFTIVFRYVHSECDALVERDKKGGGYVCPICRNEVSVVRLALIVYYYMLYS